MNEPTQVIDKFDRTFGAMHDVSLRTKPTTIENVEPITGRVETYVIQTMRHAERGDYVFIKRMDEAGVVRLALPPAVARAIASQKIALTKRSRSIRGRRVMQERMDAGFVPNFKSAKKKNA